jgi:hypothetical protein
MVAGVHQHEAACAVGVFHHARSKAGLAKEGALLVSSNAANRDGCTQHIRADLSIQRAGGPDAGQQRGGDAERFQ